MKESPMTLASKMVCAGQGRFNCSPAYRSCDPISLQESRESGLRRGTARVTVRKALAEHWVAVRAGLIVLALATSSADSHSVPAI